MTKEKAINLLKQVNEVIIESFSLFEDIYEPLNQAFDMAIKALEQQPSEDCVSRQAVLGKIKKVCFSKEWAQFRVDNGSNGQRDFLINYIEQLPPVTPTQNWVPNSERLPRQEVEVLTCNEHGFIEIQSLEDGYWENQHGDCTDFDNNNVIAWQPLPKPYEEKRGNMEINQSEDCMNNYLTFKEALNALKKSFLSDKNSLWFLFGVWIGFVIIAILKLLILKE